jgi:hypothetical protein
LEHTTGVVLNAWRLFIYGVLFMLGEGYLTVLIAGLKWPRAALFVAIACWGALLLAGEWYRHQRRKGEADTLQK